MNKTIVIDAGHGGKDSGAVNGARLEKIAALAIAIKTGNRLAEAGYDVNYTRTTDAFVSLANRCRISNECEADAFISVHINSAENKDATGAETWRFDCNDSVTKALAKIVQTELISATFAKDRGTKTTTALYVLKHTIAPAVLVECGFISNDGECAKIFSNVYQNKVADAIARGVAKALK